MDFFLYIIFIYNVINGCMTFQVKINMYCSTRRAETTMEQVLKTDHGIDPLL